MKIYKDLFSQITSPINLFAAWEEFQRGKSKKADVQKFEFSLEQNLFSLHRDLLAKCYSHGPYTEFYICDPKVRHIHKATVRDRVLHHAVSRILSPLFNKTFITHSFSCRVGKGSHKGVLAVEAMLRAESRNYTIPCFALKCDVRKFFDSVNHEILLAILKKRIADSETLWLLTQIIRSFSSGQTNLFDYQGLPLGNLTSQLFANVYMNEFDQFAKHQMRIKHYARYTDDIVVISFDKKYLQGLIEPFQNFLHDHLKLTLHPKKTSLRTVRQGIDFLGYVILPHYRLLRNKTKRRMFRKLKYQATRYRQGEIDEQAIHQSLQSYLGILSHAQSYQLSQDLKNQYWYWLHE